ncbi:eukaryotic translation initiation factor 5B-like isoform X2 [Hibiscus syriacus]|uniref:eukaryotic translation initiation factor 5B-like isoform X2 n=1 Tax=Hibiscus syriacus TaxID=106335 RepID=UPI0019203DFA|nr:eukaryotic translation initiation factor 5B-like isoform X2 [Hibiscus syriacus]
MDPQRPHRSTSINNSSTGGNNTTTTTRSSTSELFICFTSRLSSSSSMKIPSKSIISPGRSREPSCSQISLSSSLSRRLRSNGSMKGCQASPMFPTTSNGKKKGGGLDNPEPSSPKVTCIGQVRVKTTKQGKKLRACKSKRREVSFIKVDHGNGSSNNLDHQDYNMGHFLRSNSHHHQQQQQECKKWVHFPLTICEALRAFGSEFNCFLPCRSSSMANQRDNNKEGKKRGSENGNGNGNGRYSSSCGAVFTRWLVAVQEGEGKEREIELVVGGEDDDDERRQSSETMMRSSQRRHVFEDIEINDFVTENIGDDEDEARVSICIPPKNALLLMRCRSDPVKMAALANKFWETPVPKDESEEKLEEQEGLVQDDTVEAEIEHEEVSEVSEMIVSCEANEEQEIPEAETEVESVLVKDESTELVEETSVECQDQEHENVVVETQQEKTLKEQILTEVSLDDVEKPPIEENESAIEDPLQQEAEDEEEEREDQTEAEEEEEDSTVEGEGETAQERSEFGKPETREPDSENESKENESREKLLPDCLLLMMCEPKLSMEVSKETWVCSTDFIRWLPEKRKQPVVKQKDSGDEPKRRISVDSNPRPIFLQPPRYSCSFPAAPQMDTAVAAASNGAGGGGSMTTTKDHKVVGGKGYEPFALTRCKSEPRKPSAKLAPDAYFWKNKKLEPTSLGVGAAGVGF